MPFGEHVHFSTMAACNVRLLLENGTNGQFIGLMLMLTAQMTYTGTSGHESGCVG